MPAPAMQYRLDLDGLRGLAILLVVAYHVWALGVSGGVDVFLALSGFFFVGMLLRTIRRGTDLSPLPVIKRLARRLLPALLTVLIATALAAYLLIPFTRWDDIARQLLASAGYYQNWYLAVAAGDYLAADPATSPLQHLWSMSVQGQFFLASLLATYASAWIVQAILRRHPRRHIWSARAATGVIIAVTISSFAYAAIHVVSRPSWNYYDTFARTWQLLLGGAIAALLPLIRVPSAARPVLALGGLAAIAATGQLLDGRAQFPGPWALVPVLGTIAIIIAGANATRSDPVRALLGSGPLVWLGTLAYAFYLWHWPILIFYLIHTGKPATTFLEGLAIIAASLACAWLTLRYIEAPLRYSHRNPAPSESRRRWKRRSTYPAIGIGLATILMLAAAGGWLGYIASRDSSLRDPPGSRTHPGALALTDNAPVPDARLFPDPLDIQRDHPITARDKCIANYFTAELVICEYGDTSAARTIALVGGSHAEQWISAMHPIGLARGFRVSVIVKMGCPMWDEPDPRHFDGLPYPECRDWNVRLAEHLIATQPGFVLTNSTRPLHDGTGDFIPGNYVEAFKALSSAGINVLGIRDNPWLWPFPNPADCLAGRNTPEQCGAPRSTVLRATNPADEWAEQIPGMVSLDMSDAICGTTHCRAVEGNIAVYRDFNHLTASYVRSMIPELDRQLGDATAWW